MISIASLWLPILLSAVAVFIVSSIIHMLLPYHRSNLSAVPDEQNFRDTVRPLQIPAGEYMFPYAGSPKNMESEEYQQKLKEGPVGILVSLPNGPWPMGKSLVQWFIYSLVVGIFAAYIAVQSLQVGANYLAVMQMVGASAFAGYALSLPQNSIWYFRAWSTTAKFIFDGIIYALLTGGIFGWLWPAA
ncbi:hypothetical protein [Aliikangiella coralliicola]|uniref:DUF1761 domain-containing protein n=1 Tax=Aliikangiella coralliicola TaxID=2592383 RepID=A0A545U6E2_9GAMM|nr:hypothetical protein [Aliikangiella coralliicola]TQV85037.1 hypothetical protein FLL46_21850 [Aliikangiella coralliicola]